MTRYVVVPIVEGHGEVAAVPILVRRWLKFRRYHNVDVVDAIFSGGSGALKVTHDGENELGVEYYIEIALLRQPDVILVIVDADKDCPKNLGPDLLARSRRSVPADFPVGVVVANREYEAWFLAAFNNPRFQNALVEQKFSLSRRALPRGTNVEAIADCKGHTATLIGVKSYEPRIHQPTLTNILPFTRTMTERSRSFRKLLKELNTLMIQARRRRP